MSNENKVNFQGAFLDASLDGECAATHWDTDFQGRTRTGKGKSIYVKSKVNERSLK